MNFLSSHRIVGKVAAGIILAGSTLVYTSIASAEESCTNYCSANLCTNYITSDDCNMAAVLTDSTVTLSSTPIIANATKCSWDTTASKCGTTSSAQDISKDIPCCAPKS